MAQIQVYDRDNQTWVPAQDSDVTDMVASGKYGLQAGIDIPITFADGTMGTVPSEHFEEGAANGDFRFQTKADLNAYEAQQQSAILQKNFGSEGQAAIAGGMRGFTLGLSDPGMVAMGALSGHGEDVKQGLKATQQNSPVISAGSEIGGMVLNPLGGEFRAAGKAAGSVAGSVMGDLGAGALTQGMASGIAGTALEGGFWGIGQGISEATLGNPDEVAQNLVAGPAMGVLFGGAFGAGFEAVKEAAPFFKSAINKVSNRGEELVNSVLQKGAKAGIGVVPNIAEQQAFQDAAGELANMPEARQLYFEQGPEKFREAVSQSEKIEADLTKRAEGIKDNLYKSIEGLPDTIQSQIKSDFEASTGDLGSTLETGAGRLEANRQLLNTAMKADQTPGEMFMEIHDATTEAIKTLEQTRDLRARAIARELNDRLAGEMAARKLYITTAENGARELTQGSTTAGSEAILSDELQNIAGRGLDSTRLPMRARDMLEALHGDLGEMSRGNPVFGEQMGKLQDQRAALNSLREFATDSMKESNTNVKNSVIKSILTDPRKARDFDQLLSNTAEFMPEFQAYRDAATNASTRMNALREASAKFEGMRNKMFDRSLSLDDIQNVFESFQGAPKNIGEKITELRNVQGALNQADSGAISKFVRLSKFMGNEVAPEIANLQKYEGAFQTLDKLGAAGAQKDPIKSLAFKIATARIARRIGRWVGGPVVGEMAGAAAELVANKGLNTYNTLKTLTTLEKANRASGRIMRSATEKAINAMTGASKVAGPAAGVLGEKYLKETPRPLSKARKDFKERASYLTRLTADPEFMTAEAQKRIDGLEHAAPGVAASLSKQFAGTAYYLASTMPKDPTIGKSLNMDPAKSAWEPSDKDLASWERRVATAENPARAIADMADGKMSREALETLQTLHPVAFGKLQQGVNDAIMNGDTKLTYAQKMQVGQLLGVRADPSLDPSFVQAMQANMSAQGPGAPPKGPRGPYKGGVYPSRLNLNTDAMGTETTRVTNA